MRFVSAARRLDCYFESWASFSSPFYAQATATALLPLICMGACAAFWCIRRLLLNKFGKPSSETAVAWSDVRSALVVSTVVVLFLLHIMLTKTALRFFTCTQPIKDEASFEIQSLRPSPNRIFARRISTSRGFARLCCASPWRRLASISRLCGGVQCGLRRSN